MYKYNKYFYLILIKIIINNNYISLNNFKYNIINYKNIDFTIYFFNNLIYFLKKKIIICIKYS